jgi:hypothetical protein
VRSLGIRNEDDLFGGVVPHPFVATKTITHPLIDSAASRPPGWRPELGEQLYDVVLFGYSAFSREDALKAGKAVLKRGAARLKPARGIAGRGQEVVATVKDLERVVESLSSAELSVYGVVIEQNFDQIETYSVGQIRFGNLIASYYGTQSLTKDNCAADVYGGSTLFVARGGYEMLLKLDIAANVRGIVAKGRAYERAVAENFPTWIASRRNYDVAVALDGRGRRHCGVLEQSWRIGGASPAEIGALEAFQADPNLGAVRASSVQVYGPAEIPIPEGAVVYFQGEDSRVGPITKYAMVQPYGSSH